MPARCLKKRLWKCLRNSSMRALRMHENLECVCLRFIFHFLILIDFYKILSFLFSEPTKYMIQLVGTGVDYPICLPLRSRETNTVDMLLNEIDRLQVFLSFFIKIFHIF